MSSAESPSGPLTAFSSTANLRVLYQGRRSWSNYKLAHILLSSRINWKEAKKDGTNQPQSVLDFRDTNSLELVRLDNGSWEEVDEMVRVEEHDERLRIMVRGRLQGQARGKTLFFVRGVELEVIPNTRQQCDVWVKIIRARIAPWNLLQKEMKDACGIEKLEIALGGLATSMAATKLSSRSADNVEEKWSDDLCTLPEQMQKLSIVEKLTTHGAATVGLAGTLEKLVSSAERETETAELFADLSKRVTGVSTIFQLVSLSAQGVSIWAEANRGQRVLPVALCQITILLRYALETLSEINKPPRRVNDTDKDFVFHTLKQTICIMDGAEVQLLRGRGSQIKNAVDVKEVERKLEELIHRVVTAGTISKLCVVDEKVSRIEEGREIWSDGPHHVVPSVSVFFSGRKKELKTLEEMLENFGSAVITQFGGVGKTELMIAFADLAERKKQVPGGVFWVTVDRGVREVIGSLAGLAEKLIGRKMSEEECRNANSVIAALKQGLSGRQGRWLLCLDNADNNKVSGILNEVCGIGKSSRGNGWVIITSRQGRPHIWDRMKNEQKLPLERLCAEDAMVALWRHIRKIETVDVDDDKVMTKIKELKDDDQVEYCVLKKLCGDDSVYGLGGLPLALVQAGSFIARFRYSFAEYLNLLQNASNEEWQDSMNKTEELKSNTEPQRSI